MYRSTFPENVENVRGGVSSRPRSSFYDGMARGGEIDSAPYIGRDIRLPFDLPQLYPANDAVLDRLNTTRGPYKLATTQISLRVRFYSVFEGFVHSGGLSSLFLIGGKVPMHRRRSLKWALFSVRIRGGYRFGLSGGVIR